MAKITIKCETCGKPFEVFPNRLKKGARYCSNACHYKTLELKCLTCGKTFKAGNYQKDTAKYCSKSCQYAQRRLEFRQALERRLGQPLQEALYQAYIVERKSYRKMCKQFGVNNRTIMKLLKEHNIPARQRSDAVKTQWENNDQRRKKQGQIFIQSRKDIVGPKHFRWIGGHDDHKISEELMDSIRGRDKHQCTRCGISNGESLKLYKRTLHVHHIVPYELSEDDSPSNLRTLCPPCHCTIDQEFIYCL